MLFVALPILQTRMKTYNLNPSVEVIPQSGDEFLLIWEDLASGHKRQEKALKEDLLALKIVTGDITAEQAANEGNVSVRFIDNVLDRASEKGLLILPVSKIVREGDHFYNTPHSEDEHVMAETFTLQWHITNACDLHCKHCYDRSNRSSLTLKQGISILDELRFFCGTKEVNGHVCFTGGNPFMHSDFFGLYEYAVNRGFSTSILGNPVPKKTLQRLCSIQRPSYFQVSLEGLELDNDLIRGKDHFKRVMTFFDVLKEVDISSAVMLTLTEKNMDQVVALSDLLKDKAEYFTFNRLSQVGEGAGLTLPSKNKYISFLDDYTDSVCHNPIVGYKDNLINIVLKQKRNTVFSGCTGYGCGAAFNFMTLLPDGEVHACRKFPSYIGNVLNESMDDIYQSEKARQYREGSAACKGCSIRPVCGGCMAVVHGCGMDVFTDKDPYCFFNEK